MRVSNEPCTDKATERRVELARKRRSVDLDVYGECRDSEQTPCVCEPVGKANCVPTESTAVRKTVICALAMSHAQTKQQRGASSSLESGDLLIWLYTANAATVTSPSELCKRSAFANLSAWIIASRPNPQQFEKL